MKYKTAIFWLAMAGVAGAVLFQTSYEVQELEEKLASLNRKIVAEQEAIQVLKAEWSFLNDPTRLENLARTHLNLRPTEAKQFLASIEAVPFRPASAPAAPDAAPASPSGAQPHMVKLSPGATEGANKAPAPASSAGATAPKPAKPAVTGPTAIAAKPLPAPTTATPGPKTLTPPPGATAVKPAAQAPAGTNDSMGVLIARLGANSR